jgi:hypothetical protein
MTDLHVDASHFTTLAKLNDPIVIGQHVYGTGRRFDALLTKDFLDSMGYRESGLHLNRGRYYFHDEVFSLERGKVYCGDKEIETIGQFLMIHNALYK